MNFTQEELDWINARRVAHELIAATPHHGLGGVPMVWTADDYYHLGCLVGEIDPLSPVEREQQINDCEARSLQAWLRFQQSWPFPIASRDKVYEAFKHTYMGG